MKIRNAVYLVLIALSILSCHKGQQGDITKIEYARGVCFGSCIPVAISVDSQMNYKFFADSAYSWDKLKHGQVSYTGIINKKWWDSLTDDLNKADFSHPDTEKKIEIADAQHSELIIYYSDKKIRIYEPDKKLEPVTTLLDSLHKMIKLKRVNNNLTFGTTLQEGMNPVIYEKKQLNH